MRRAGVALLAALAPAVALAVDPGGWFPFGPVKWLLVSVLVLLGSGLVLARQPARIAAVPTVASVALVAWMAVAAAFGADPTYAWTGTPERHFGVITWGLCALALVVGQSIDPIGDGRRLIRGLIVAGGGVGAVATAEAFGLEPDVLDVATRLTGSFGSSAYLGAAAALLLPVAVGVLVDRTAPTGWRGAAGVAASTLAVAVIGSGARAAWVGLAVSGVAVAWAGRHGIAARRRLAAAGAIAGAVVLAGVVVLTPAGGRLASAFDRDAPGGQGRTDEWRVASQVAIDHPVAGVGPEGYRIEFATGADASYERAHGRDPLPDRAHAAPLDVLLAGGAPALVAWTVLMLAIARAAIRSLAGGQPQMAGLAAGVIAYLAAELLLFPLAELEPVVLLAAGVLLSADARTDAGATRVRTAVVPRPLPVALGGLAGLALVAGAFDVAADRRAAEAATALGRGEPSRAVTAAAAATRLRPDEVRLHLLHARALVAAERGALAGIAAVDDALAVSPGDPIALRERLELLVARAEATLVPSHADQARREADRLLDHDPFNAGLWLQAGIAARLAGDDDAAIAALERADDLAPTSPAAPTDLAILYLERGDVDAARAAVERALARAPADPRARAVLALVEATR